MESQTTINLIKERSEVPEYIQPVQTQFRNISLLALIVTVIAGVATLVIFLSFRIYNQSLISKKNTLNRTLAELKPQETIYLTIKSRLPVVEKALTEGKPMSKIISLVMETQTPPGLSGVTFNETGTAEFRVALNSLEESMEVVRRFLEPHLGVSLTDPVLNSFSMSDEGTNISLSFMPLWEEVEP